MAASDVLVSLGADSSELQSSLSGLADDVVKWVGGLNPAVAGAVTVIAGIGVTAFQVAEEFHEATNQIAVATGATGPALDAMGESMRNVFKGVPQEAAEVGRAIGDVSVALGLTGTQLEGATKGFLDMADSLGTDVGPLIESTVGAMNAWGVAAGDATLIQDKLLTVVQQTGIDAVELANGLKQGEGTFKQWGLSIDESAVMLGRFHKAGLDAGTVTGALQKAIKAMSEEGIAPSKEALVGLIDGIKNAGSESASTQAAIDLFGKSGVQMGQAIREGKLDLDGLTEALANAEGQVARTDDATAPIGENFVVLSHNLQALLEPLGVVLVDGLNAVVQGFAALLDPMTYTSDGFQAILNWLQPLTDAFTGAVLPAFKDAGTLLLGLGVTVIQGALIPALTFLWNNVLVPLGGFMRDVLAGAINLVYGAISSFLGVLKEIPGVSALFEAGQKAINTALGDGKTKADEAHTATTNLKGAHEGLASTLNTGTHPAIKNVIGALGDKSKASDLAKQAAKDLEDAEKTLADGYSKLQVPAIKNVLEAQRDVDKARKDLTDNTKKLFDAEQDLKAKLDNTKTSSKDLETSMKNLDAAKKAVKTSTDNLKSAQTSLSDAQKKSKEDADKLKASLDAVGKELEKIPVEIAPQFESGLGLIGGSMDTLVGKLSEGQSKAFEVQNALLSMSITPKEDLKKLADEADAKYKLIRDSGLASASEVELAQKNSLDAMVGYYKQAGIDVPAELATTLSNLKGKYEGHKTDVVSVFDTMKGAVQSSITQLSTDLVQSLWTDPGSFGGKALDTLKGLGQAVTTAFITPAQTAISNFISGSIADLLGGKGLGAIQDRLGDIGDAFSGLFGGGGSTPSVPGSVPSVPGGNPASGAGGVASGAASGAASWIGAIGSAVTAIASVASLFGVGVEGTMKETLNGIHNDTTYLAKAFGDMGLKDSLLNLSNNFKAWMDGGFGGWYREFLIDQSGLQYEMNDRQKEMLTQLENISGTMTNKLATSLDQLIAKKTEVTNNISVYLDGDEISAAIEEKIQAAIA